MKRLSFPFAPRQKHENQYGWIEILFIASSEDEHTDKTRNKKERRMK